MPSSGRSLLPEPLVSRTATLLLSPPYRSLVPLAEIRDRPRLGAVALLRDLGILTESIPRAGWTIRGAPWVPVVVELRHVHRVPAAELSHAVLVSDGNAPPSPAAVLAALGRRPPPTPEQLGRWLATRIGQSDLAVVLAAAIGFRRSVRYPVHERTVRRTLARHGLPRRLAWTRLGDLTRLSRSAGNALQFGGEARLALWLRRLGGVSIGTWRRQPGWEWLAEGFVRRWLPARPEPLSRAGARAGTHWSV